MFMIKYWEFNEGISPRLCNIYYIFNWNFYFKSAFNLDLNKLFIYSILYWQVDFSYYVRFGQ